MLPIAAAAVMCKLSSKPHSQPEPPSPRGRDRSSNDGRFNSISSPKLRRVLESWGLLNDSIFFELVKSEKKLSSEPVPKMEHQITKTSTTSCCLWSIRCGFVGHWDGGDSIITAWFPDFSWLMSSGGLPVGCTFLHCICNCCQRHVLASFWPIWETFCQISSYFTLHTI